MATSTANTLDIRPLSGALGAEILGIDLAHEVERRDDRGDPRRMARAPGGVLPRPGARTRAAPALAKRFGEPVEYPFVKGLDGFPQITPVIKLEHEKVNFGGLWHSDTAYLEQPPMATMLIARETPPRGGDTLFANMYLAYETLSDGIGACSTG
jgi:taurine dioxygenase